MFDHGIYRCDNNKEQHYIDSIVHKKSNIADGEVFHARTIIYSRSRQIREVVGVLLVG